jgi:hypothetical protein
MMRSYPTWVFAKRAFVVGPIELEDNDGVFFSNCSGFSLRPQFGL